MWIEGNSGWQFLDFRRFGIPFAFPLLGLARTQSPLRIGLFFRQMRALTRSMGNGGGIAMPTSYGGSHVLAGLLGSKGDWRESIFNGRVYGRPDSTL